MDLNQMDFENPKDSQWCKSHGHDDPNFSFRQPNAYALPIPELQVLQCFVASQPIPCNNLKMLHAALYAVPKKYAPRV